MKATPIPAFDSHQIVELLRMRHKDDVFVDECKDGPTQGCTYNRLDAWAMRRSWSRPCMTGYEVKVSRSDFLRDDKWPNYLPLCNELYFACAPGIVSAEELPKEVGLVEMTSKGGRLVTKKRAHHRQIVCPESLYQYILMCRVKVTRDRNTWGADENAAYWHKWAEEKDINERMGHRLSYLVWRHVDRLVQKTRDENSRLKAEIDRWQESIDALKEAGFVTTKERPDGSHAVTPVSRWDIRELKRDLQSVIGSENEAAIRNLKHGLDKVVATLEAQQKERVVK